MPLSPGDKLGSYEIVAPLGAGGMGEVYRARDPKLNREVAIKVLPASLANDAQYMARFEREAQMLAALNHPNIATVYGIEQGALVMELVEGANLNGPLPLEEALAIARQIAAGLEAAHEKGIVHRDLKPANIKLTPAAVVKILDFGLAKTSPEASAASGSNLSMSPTLSIEMTRAGVILGTAAYMSPEQARGKAVDKRTDIWAFGVVLYEIVTGKRLFEGEDLTETMASVVKDRPDLSGVPAKVRPLLERCLEKDPKKRLRDIGDLEFLLKEKADEGAGRRPGGAPHQLWPWVAAALFAGALGTLSFVHFREAPPAREVVRFQVIPTAGAASNNLAVSPDGRKVAFLAAGPGGKAMVWVRSLESEEARPVTGSEGAQNMFWSPDGRFLAFPGGGKLKRIEAGGGPAETVCDMTASAPGTWIAGNRILFGNIGGGVQLVSASGGTPTAVTSLDLSHNELGHAPDTMLPDGRHFLYTRLSLPIETSTVYIGALDGKKDGQSDRKLVSGITSVYSPSPLTGDSPGLLMYLRGLTVGANVSGTLVAQPFDAKRMEFAGEAVPIAEQVSSFSASANGVLVFRTAGAGGDRQLTWYDRKGAVLSTAGEAGEYGALSLSPDGTRAAYSRGIDIWLFEFARGGVATKFTFGSPSNAPAWAADGTRIVFVSIRAGGFGIYQRASNMAGQEELLYQSQEVKGVPNWTHDGKFVMYSGLSSSGKNGDLLILPPAGSAAERKPVPFLQTQFTEVNGRFSPDDRWVAYQSDQSGKTEIYVLPFDASNLASPAAGGLHQVSKDGGTVPRWSQGGKELVYLAPDGNLMSVDVKAAGSVFQTGAALPLFKLPAGATWDVQADGKRFLIAAPVTSGATPASLPFHIVMNWTGLLKR